MIFYYFKTVNKKSERIYCQFTYNVNLQYCEMCIRDSSGTEEKLYLGGRFNFNSRVAQFYFLQETTMYNLRYFVTKIVFEKSVLLSHKIAGMSGSRLQPRVGNSHIRKR